MLLHLKLNMSILSIPTFAWKQEAQNFDGWHSVRSEIHLSRQEFFPARTRQEEQGGGWMTVDEALIRRDLDLPSNVHLQVRY